MASHFRIVGIFLALFAVVAAEIGWKRSTRYVYQYETTVVSAIPELNSDFSGLGVRGKLVIEVGSDGKKLVCQIKNPEVGHTDEDLTRKSSPDDWKRYVRVNYHQMPQKAADPLTQPFIVEFAGGSAKSIETPKDEPTWSVNMKKGIASQLTINLGGSNKVSISSTDSLRHRDVEMNLVHNSEQSSREFFAVQEDSVEGKCKTLYTISPLSEVMAQTEERDLPDELRAYYKERPVKDGEAAHIITKVRDFDDCEEKAYYYMDSFIDINPGSGNPSNNQYKMFTARSAITRYLVRGEPENFRVEKAWSQGELVMRPYGTETEKVYTITNQTLTLLEIDSPSKTQIPADLRLGDKDSLTFRFPQALQFPDAIPAVRSHEPFFIDTEFSKHGPRKLHGHKESSMHSEMRSDPFLRHGGSHADPESSTRSWSSKGSRSSMESDSPFRHESLQDSEPFMRSGSHTGSESSLKPDSFMKSQSSKSSRPSSIPSLEEFFSEKSTSEDERDSSYEVFKRHHTMDSISYFPKEGDGSLHRSSHLESNQKLPNVFHYVFPGAAFGTLKKPEARSVVQQVEFLIDETGKDIIDGHDVAKRGTALKALEIARAMTILDTDELSEIFHMVLGGSADRVLNVKRALILDCLIMAGTEPAIMLVLDMIETQKVTGEEAIQLVSTLPTSFKTNSLPVLKKLMDLVERHANDPERLKSDYHKRQLWITSMLTLTRMVTQVCLSKKVKIQNHPYVSGKSSGEGCTPNSGLVTSRVLPYMEQELNNAQEKWKKAAVLQALSNLAHPHVIEIVKPIIHGSAGHTSTDIHIRSKAVYALNRLADVHPQMVFRELKPVYTNFNDHYEIRMSAFSVIMKTRPPVAFWQEAATLTWFEPSQQVSSFVYSTIANLANATAPAFMNASAAARMALPLAKPQHLGLHYSRNILIQNFVREKQMGTTFQLGYFGSEESVIPRAGYFRFAVDAGGFGNDFIEVSVHGKGIQSAFNNFFMRYLHQEESSFPSFWNKMKDSPLRKEMPMEDIQEFLKVDPRADEPLEGSLSIKFSGQIERFFTFDTMSVRQMITEGLRRGKSMSGEGLNVEMPVSWHKVIMLPSLLGLLPSQSGLPTMVTMKRPLIVSVTGTIGIEVTPPKSGAHMPTIVLKVNLNPTIAANNIIMTGVICPITNEVFAAGVDWHASRTMPVNMEVGYDSSSKKFKVDFSRFQGQLPNAIRFVHIHQRPFVTRKHILDFTPIPNLPKTKFVQVEPTQAEDVTTVGSRYLGLPVVFERKLDSPYMDFAGLYHLFKTYGLSTIQLIHMPHTLRKLDYSIYVPVSDIKVRNVSIALEYFEGDKDCGIYGTECDKQVTEKFYGPETRARIRTGRINWNDWETLMNRPGHSNKLEEFFRNPKPSIEECKQKIHQCKEVYEAAAQRESDMNQISSRWRRDLRQSEEAESRRISSGNTRGLNLRIVLDSEAHGEKVSQITMHYTRSTEGVGQKFTIQGELHPLNEDSPYKVFVSGKIQYPTLEPTQKRKALLDNPHLAKAHIEAKFGRELRSGVTADIAMSRSVEQRENAERSPEAHRCEQDEAKGQMYSPACLAARHQATTINKYVIKLKAEEPTQWMRNLTYHMDDFLKYFFYPHMINDRVDVQNPSDSVTVVLNARPPQARHPYTVLDAYIFKPYENTVFEHLKMHPLLDGIFPLNSKRSFNSLVEHKLFRDQFFPMCKLELATVRTFDNVTYDYKLSDCYHVIAKDCSQNIKVAVMAREKNGAKTVKVTVGTTNIVIRPQSEQQITGEETLPLTVEVNGKELKLSPMEHRSLTESGASLTVKMRRDREIEVQAPAHGLRVISSGKRMKVQMSNLFRGRTCGLCGDMNGERYAEYKGPSKCVFLEPESFARSYALITRDCHLPPQMHGVSGKSGKCVSQAIKPLGMVTGYQLEDITSSTLPSNEPQTCTTYTTKVQHNGDELCFSVKPLPECSLDCRPVKLVTKRVGFHCLPNTPVTTAIMARARYGVVESLLNKQAHIAHQVSVPESCERIRH